MLHIDLFILCMCVFMYRWYMMAKIIAKCISFRPIIVYFSFIVILSHFVVVKFDVAYSDYSIISPKNFTFLSVSRVFINISRQFTHCCSTVFPKHIHFFGESVQNLRDGHNLTLIF